MSNLIIMSTLRTYKNIVSEVYSMGSAVAQGKHAEASVHFNSFLEQLAAALESKDSVGAHGSIHIPPHLEIFHEPKPDVVVVKDTDTKNIVLRPSAKHVPDDIEMDCIEETAVESAPESAPECAMDVEEAKSEVGIPDEGADADAEDVDEKAETKETEEEEEEVEADGPEDEAETEEIEEIIIRGKKYYLAPESKRVFEYVDDENSGDLIGKLVNGNIVPI